MLRYRPRSLLAQFLVPTLVVVVGIGFVVPAVQAMLAARRQGARQLAHLQAIAEGLRGLPFPLSASVLERLKALTGADFAVADRDGRVQLSTVPVERLQMGRLPSLEQASVTDIAELPRVELAGRSYLAAVLLTPPAEPGQRLVVLYPRSEWQLARWRAARVPLLLGGSVALIAAVWVLWHAWRLSHALGAIRASVRLLPQAVRDPSHAEQEPMAISSEVDALRLVIQEAAQELGRLEQEIAERERERVVAQVASGLAHHVRNSLAAARLLLALHREDCPASGDGAPELEQMGIELQLAEHQLRGLLYLARGLGRSEGQANLNETVQTAVALVSPRCDHQGIVLEVENIDGGLLVRASAEAVQTALISLLLNALDAVPGDRGRIVVRVVRDGAYGCVEVADNGPGVDEAMRKRLFEPCATDKPGGLGLGLTIARQICRSAGGDIVYRREPAATVFTLRLPLAGAPDHRSGRQNQHG